MAETGVSRPTARNWVRRWRAEGDSGPHDRSSRPRTTPYAPHRRSSPQVCRPRTGRECGPARIGQNPRAAPPTGCLR
ncbi:helix-turn-helix domain-containing protein [Streptomyces sp. NPDC007088]|uniref:helix-turn-helix domain-containing protein n=1 Tax=Streptomyces sp. NPDC007088 TaxID=3364773 RepID=UPI0036BD017C